MKNPPGKRDSKSKKSNIKSRKNYRRSVKKGEINTYVIQL